MPPKPTIVTASLDDQQLRESIEKLVNSYKGSLESMKEATNQAVENMRNSLMSLGKVKIDMSGAFDNVESAKKKLSGAATGGSGSASASAPDTIGALKQQIEEQKKVVDQQKEYSNELQAEVNYLERLKGSLKYQLKSEQQITEERRKRIAKAQSTQLTAFGRLPDNDLKSAEYKLRKLLGLKDELRRLPLLDISKIQMLNNRIQETINKVRELRKKPPTLKQVLGMDASSLDAIQAKMKAIANFRMNVNADAHPRVIQMLNKEYDELHKKQIRLMGQNASLVRSNRVLGSAFGYLRNRIIYAFTLGALAKFFKDVRDIRAEYEMLDRSIGILVGDFEKGTQIFNELNQMALKSPFTLIELGTAAKQLTAYNFAANEVVDTTRRLADISAALGVPMERLTYNLGQIKAQGVLNARDARDFANAGLAIVPMLAKMYTEQKTFGDELVTTAQVYDMMSKKMVTYADVLKVLQQATDEGGKFFNFQARQADTLKVKIANLSLAYNNMLNEIGKENQGILSGSIGLVRSLFENWREVTRAILSVIATLGVYKTLSMIAVGWKSISAWLSLAKSIKSAKDAMALFNITTKANPLVLLISALAAAASYFVWFKDKTEEATVEVERFGESASKQMKKVDTLGKVLNGVSENSTTYKNALSELNQIVTEYGLTEIKNRDEINSKIEQTIQLIKEEGKERQYANNIAKGEERYQNDIENAKAKIKKTLLDLNDNYPIKKELKENADAISDVTSTIVEENVKSVVNKSGAELEKGINEIRNKLRKGYKSMGISEQASNYLLKERTGFIYSTINGYKSAAEEHERYNQKITAYYKEANKATKATMAFTNKVDANARALRNNSNDALSLYNNVYRIVELAKKKHTINFDLKLTAQNPPKWMFSKSLPELQELARRFAAIAQSGGHAKGHTVESTYERALQYAAAARTKQEDEERKSRQKDTKTRTKQSDEIAKAIKGEISLVKELQSAYDTLTKKGDSHANAIAKVQDLYGKTIDLLNKDMDKFGLPRLDLSIIKGNNYNEVLAFFERLRDVLESKGLSNLERMEAVDGVVKEFRLKADTYNLDMITKGLNNELGKLKDEYELAVELDANPEMGNMFAEMFGIDTSGLPQSIDEYMYRAQQEFDKKRAELKYNAPLDIFRASSEDWERWGKEVGLSEEALKSFNGKFVEAQGLAKKWATDVVNNTKKLEYELADLDKKIAIKEQEQLDLQKQIDKESNEEQRYYLMLLKQNNEKAINELRAQALSLMPEYARVFNGIAEHSAVVARRLQQDLKRIFDTAKFDSSTNKWTLTSGNGKETILDDKTYRREREKLIKEMRKSQSPFQKIKEAFKPSDKNGVVDYAKGIELLSGEIQKLGNVASEVGNLAQIFGADEQTVEIINDVATSLNGVATAGQGITQIASGDYIGGAASVLSGVVSVIGAWADNSDKQISAEIKESELAVKRLELTYKNLEVAIENAYGANVIGAKQAAIANKELQLAELKRQLALEKARDSKHRDEARIIELQGQIIDLQNDIKRSAQEIATELLGISSVGDAALSFMDAYISALRKGEDAQAAFTGSWKEMIANMIKQLWVTKVIGPQLEKLVDDLNERLKGRSVAEAKAYEEAVNEHTNRQNMSDDEIREMFIQDELNRWMSEEWDRNPITLMQKRLELMNSITQEQIDAYRQEAENKVKETKMNLDKATTPTIEDMRLVAQAGEDLIPLLQASDDAINAMLDEFGLNDYSNNLSSLQQGLRGITENTAGALEAYMNGVSQQVYYQSDVLTQIRDTVQSFDMDIQTGTLSQILLQLQASFQTQNAIRSILEGWSSANGMSMRVELVQ